MKKRLRRAAVLADFVCKNLECQISGNCLAEIGEIQLFSMEILLPPYHGSFLDGDRSAEHWSSL